MNSPSRDCDIGHEHERSGTLLSETIRHLELSPYAQRSHASCHHARKGRSYVLIFKLATMLAMKYEGRVLVWNEPSTTDGSAKLEDPDFGRRSYPGYFLFETK